MKKFLLLWSVTLVLAGAAAAAEPPAVPPPPAAVLQGSRAPAPLCEAQAPLLFPALNARLVPIRQGNPCDRAIDCWACRPAGM